MTWSRLFSDIFGDIFVAHVRRKRTWPSFGMLLFESLSYLCGNMGKARTQQFKHVHGNIEPTNRHGIQLLPVTTNQVWNYQWLTQFWSIRGTIERAISSKKSCKIEPGGKIGHEHMTKFQPQSSFNGQFHVWKWGIFRDFYRIRSTPFLAIFGAAKPPDVGKSQARPNSPVLSDPTLEAEIDGRWSWWVKGC